MNARSLSAWLLPALLLAPLARAQVPPEASALVERRDYPAAVALLEARLAQVPDDAASRFLLARTLAWDGRPAQALPHYRRLLDAEPRNSDYLLGQGQALLWSGQRDAAATVLRQASTLAPDDPDIARALAQAQADAATDTDPAPIRHVALLLHGADLDRGNANWRGARLEVGQRARGRPGMHAAVFGETRFGHSDHGIEVGAALPLGPGWTLQPQASWSPGARVIARQALDLRIAREFGRGWVGNAGIGHSRYADADVARLALGVERYVGDWRWSWGANAAQLRGRRTLGQDLRIARAYGDGGEAGLLLAAGREPAIVDLRIVPASVRAAGVFGRHPLADRWVLLWNATHVRQGEAHTRRAVGLGLERRF